MTMGAILAAGAVGPAYPANLAVVNGGGLILCGLWMKRA